MDAIPGPSTGMETRFLAASREGSWPPHITAASAPSSWLRRTRSRMPGAASSISGRESTDGGAALVVTSLTSTPGDAWEARPISLFFNASPLSPDISMMTSIRIPMMRREIKIRFEITVSVKKTA